MSKKIIDLNNRASFFPARIEWICLRICRKGTRMKATKELHHGQVYFSVAPVRCRIDKIRFPKLGEEMIAAP